jgi:hypothetical protein
MANKMQQQQGASLDTLMQQLQVDGSNNSDKAKNDCKHGCFPSPDSALIQNFIGDFTHEYDIAPSGKMGESLFMAETATKEKYAEVWEDSTKLNYAVTYLIFSGTEDILEGNIVHARGTAAFACFFQQFSAVFLHNSQASINTPKISELFRADEHTLV